MKNILATAALILLFALPGSAQLKPGDKAVDFSLKNIDSKIVSLSDYKDSKGVILFFTCNPCPFSKAYEERIIKTHKYYGPKGYPVVAINPNDETLSPDDTFEKMQSRASEKNFPFPYLKDETQKIYKAYGATRTPQVFLLKNENGIFRVAYIGPIDNNANATHPRDIENKYLEESLAALMKGEKPNPDTVQAIGCFIKCKK